MKKWLWIPILVILLFLFFCRKAEKTEPEDVGTGSGREHIAAISQTLETNLDLAVKNLEKGQLGEGTGLLLDSVLLVKPLDQWPEGYVKNITEAKDYFAAGNFPDAVECVSNALDLIKQPEDKELSSESSNSAPLARMAKSKIDKAKEEFEKGNADQGVVAILQALQLFAPKN